jgi:hypothetical protein
MKHKAKLSISKINSFDEVNKIRITVEDEDAGVSFVTVSIDTANFAECLTGLHGVDCEMEIRGLKNVGKVIERDTLEFQLSSNSWCDKKERAIQEVDAHVPEGWQTTKYFGSQDSFFSKGEECWARTQIKRWVDKEIPDVD